MPPSHPGPAETDVAAQHPVHAAGAAISAETHALKEIRKSADVAEEHPGHGSDAAIAPEVHDLEAIRRSVDESAAVGGGLWLSYLFVYFYLAIAAFGVTDVDLLLQNPVKLPFIDVELPLRAFFVLAPPLFLIMHAYALANLVLLSNRVRQFSQELERRVPGSDLDEGVREKRAALARQLPSSIVVEALGGEEESRRGPFGWLLATVVWLTLVPGPILLLLFLQIRFLPYHDLVVTWEQRAAILVDLVLIWWLWGRIIAARRGGSRPRSWTSWTGIGFAASALTLLFSGFVATFPGEWQDDVKPVSWLHELMFVGEVDRQTDRPRSLFSNRLVLIGFNIYEALKIDEPQKVAWKTKLIDLRARDLREAVLYDAVLTKADLTGARLRGVLARHVQLQGALLEGAHLQGASLSWAELEGADLWGAELEGASLVQAKLQGATLAQAALEGAVLYQAGLEGAKLLEARLEGASLKEAGLEGASLVRAQLQGANLEGAKLDGASLEGAFLWRAQFKDARLTDLFVPTADWKPELPRKATDLFVPPRFVPHRNVKSVKKGEQGESWTAEAYATLRQEIESVVPEGQRRSEALKGIAILDCKTEDGALASCDPSAIAPDAAKHWQQQIEAAGDTETAYGKALAKILGDLVCSGDPDRIDVLSRMVRSDRIDARFSAATGLVERILSPKCPVSTLLTDDDRARLRTIERKAAGFMPTTTMSGAP